MRFLQALVNGLVAVVVLLFGLLAGALLAIGALAVFLAGRLRSRKAEKSRSGNVNPPRDGDAIEVSATEVSVK